MSTRFTINQLQAYITFKQELNFQVPENFASEEPYVEPYIGHIFQKFIPKMFSSHQRCPSEWIIKAEEWHD